MRLLHFAMATINPSQPPAAQEYAGGARESALPFPSRLTNAMADEINALILDPGSSTTRAGFAGEDVPKSVLPTSYGVLPSGERLFGENAIHQPRPDMEIRNPFNSDGLVEDWETASKLWEYAITSRLTGTHQTSPLKNGLNDSKDEQGDVAMEGMEQTEEQERPLGEHPLLMSEAGWNPAKDREKMIEIAMEDWGVPAFFLAKNGQLAAYVTERRTRGLH